VIKSIRLSSSSFNPTMRFAECADGHSRLGIERDEPYPA